MGNIKDEDWVYLETFFNGLSEAREDLKGQIPDIVYRGLGEFTKVYSNYTKDIDKLKAQDINPYDFSKLNELEGLHIAVVNLYENALEYVIERIGETKMMEYLHENSLDISFMDEDEFKDWQESKKWVDTMKANKSEGWFNTLKNTVTTTSAGQSALQNVAYGKPKNKHERMEEEEFPIVVEDGDFWRD